MKASKNGNMVGSNAKATGKYTLLAPGTISAIGKGLSRDIGSSTFEKEHLTNKISLPLSSNMSMQYIQTTEAASSIRKVQVRSLRSLIPEKGRKSTKIPSPPSDQVDQYNQKVETNAFKNRQGQTLEIPILQKERTSTKTSFPQLISQGAIGKIPVRSLGSLTPEQGGTSTKIPFFDATNISFPTSNEKYIEFSQTIKENTSGSIPEQLLKIPILQKERTPAKISCPQPTNMQIDEPTGATGKVRLKTLRSLVPEQGCTSTRIQSSLTTEHVQQYALVVETNASENRQGEAFKTPNLQKERTPAKISFPQSTNQVEQYVQTTESSSIGRVRVGSLRSSVPEQGRTSTKNPSRPTDQVERTLENISFPQSNNSLPISIEQDMEYSQPIETSSYPLKRAKRVRGRNKCKEVATLEVGKKLKLTFYNNRTVGKNSSTFSRHLGRIVRDRNMCPLGVSSWDKIGEEKLNHMWAAVQDKFESDDMDIHHKPIMGWLRELWNKYRGKLHKKVKDMSMIEALKNIPDGVNKNDWEWLVKKHFPSRSFQARSKRNATNRAKLTMLHRMGTKPIRQLIYDKGGKNGNPPNFATVFYDSRAKHGKLVEPETIEKYAEIEELVKSQPSMPSIEIVEQCFGPQTRSHVVGFGGGVKATELKGGSSSKAELLSELRSTRDENKSLRDRMSTMEEVVKELIQFKEETILARDHNPQFCRSPVSASDN